MINTQKALNFTPQPVPQLRTIIDTTSVRVGNVIKAQDIVSADTPLSNQEIMNQYPIGASYLYTKQSDNQQIPVKLLRYDGEYAIFSAGKRGVRIKIVNLAGRIEKQFPKNNTIVYPDFSQKNASLKQPSKQRSIDEGLIYVSHIAKAFAPFQDVSEIESRALLKNKNSSLKMMERYLHLATHPNAVSRLTPKALAPVGKIKALFDKISQIANPESKEKSMKTFIAYYIRFLAVRRDFILHNNIESVKTLDKKIPGSVVPVSVTPTHEEVKNGEYIPKDEYIYEHLKQAA